MQRIDILNLEWKSKGRDIHIVEPTLIFFENIKNYTVIRSSIYFSFLKLLYYRPKMLVISNVSGAPENVIVGMFAKFLGSKVIAFVSEGDYVEEYIDSFFWGWNQKKVLFFDLILLWSERSREMLLNRYAYLDNYCQVSGATGFDRYQLFDFMKKDAFCKKYDKKFDRIILVPSYGFDRFSKIWIEANKDVPNTYSKDTYDFFLSSRNKFREILLELVEKYKDTLFILKYHPSVDYFCETEIFIEDFQKYDNLLYLKNEEDISDLINISDFLIAFDTTCSLEGWLLKKETFLLNPYGTWENRSIISEGSISVSNCEEIRDLIDKVYSNEFDISEKYCILREEIIKKVIGYGDGMNFLRSVKKISAFEKNEKSVSIKFSAKDKIYFFLKTIKELIDFGLMKSPVLNKIKYIKKIKENIATYQVSEREKIIEIYKSNIREVSGDMEELK